MTNPETLTSVVKGFLVPEYTDPATNRHEFSNVDDFNKVRLGYACAKCLAEFNVYMPVCPLCGNERDINADLGETPADVQAYYDEATGPSPGATETEPMHETIERLTRSADVEHIRIKSLKPRRWGRGA